MNIRKGLASLVLGATAFSGCSTNDNQDFIKGREEPPNILTVPLPKLTDGQYSGMNYIILNGQIAKERGVNSYIEIRDPNSKRKIKVVYNLNGSVKNLERDLPYNSEAVRKIIEKDTFFK